MSAKKAINKRYMEEIQIHEIDIYITKLEQHPLHRMIFNYLKQKNYSINYFIRLVQAKKSRNSQMHTIQVRSVNEEDNFTNDINYLLELEIFKGIGSCFTLEEKDLNNFLQVLIEKKN